MKKLLLLVALAANAQVPGFRYGYPAAPMLDLDASRMGNSLSGSSVTAWPDSSGNGNVITVTGTPQFVPSASNGMAAVSLGNRFTNNGVFGIPNTVSAAGNARTILIAGEIGGVVGGNSYGFYAWGNASGTGGGSPVFYFGSQNYKDYDFAGTGGQTNAFLTDAPTAPVGPFCMAWVIGRGYGANNGTSVNSIFATPRYRQSAGMGYTSTVLEGGSLGLFNGANNKTDIRYQRVLVYNRTISELELDGWFNYCNRKYGTEPLTPATIIQNAGGLSAVSNQTVIEKRYAGSVRNKVIFVGDGFFEGPYNGAGNNVPSQIWSQLQSHSTTFVNMGVGGTNEFGTNGPGQSIATVSSSTQAYLDAYDFTANNIYVIELGMYDIGVSNTSAAAIWSGTGTGTLEMLLAKIRALGPGVKIVLATIPLTTSCNNNSYAANCSTGRTTLNSAIKNAVTGAMAQGLADAVADPGAITGLADDGGWCVTNARAAAIAATFVSPIAGLLGGTAGAGYLPAVPGTPVKYITDTDAADDIDDVDAMALLIRLERLGYVQCIGAISTTNIPYGPPLVDTVYGYAGIGNCSGANVGAYTGSSITGPADHYGNVTVSHFGISAHPTSTGYTDGVARYRQMLNGAGCGGTPCVIIYAQGFGSNLSGLLNSGVNYNGDGLGTGVSLIQVNVIKLVWESGQFAGGTAPYSEWNLTHDPVSSSNVATNWPTPIVWDGDEVGNAAVIGTGMLSSAIQAGTPNVYAHQNTTGVNAGTQEIRQGWGPSGALYTAIGATNGYFTLSAAGYNQVNGTTNQYFTGAAGTNLWNAGGTRTAIVNGVTIGTFQDNYLVLNRQWWALVEAINWFLTR